jgi:hypothetical protein
MGTGFRRAGVPAMVALCLLSLSCASGTRLYVNPEADMAYYKKIAVLPFANLSSDNLAAPRVTRAFVTELLMAARFQIVQPEDLVGALQRGGVYPAGDGTYEVAKLKDLAAQAGITGILRGAVSEYQMTRTEAGDTPQVAFDVELLDVATGQVAWRSSIVRRGRGRLPIVGSGSRSLARLTQEACETLVVRLRKGAL